MVGEGCKVMRDRVETWCGGSEVSRDMGENVRTDEFTNRPSICGWEKSAIDANGHSLQVVIGLTVIHGDQRRSGSDGDESRLQNGEMTSTDRISHVGVMWALLSNPTPIDHLNQLGHRWLQIRAYTAVSNPLSLRSPSILPIQPCSTPPFRLVSYNLRYDIKPDDITVETSLNQLPDPTLEPSYLGLAGKEQPWSARRIRIAQDILNEGVALAGSTSLLHATFE